MSRVQTELRLLRFCGISSVGDLSGRQRWHARTTKATTGRIAVDKPPRAVCLLVCLRDTVAASSNRAGATPSGVRAGAAQRRRRGGRSCPLRDFARALLAAQTRRLLLSGVVVGIGPNVHADNQMARRATARR